ncbi:MAG: hypothetical protein ACOCSM_00395 [Bacillota bacterium]
MKDKSFEEKRRMGMLLMGFAVVLLILRNIEIWINKGFMFHYELLPLQICHFANFVLLYAFWKNQKTFFAFAWTLNLPAAYASIIFANGLENYETLLTYRGVAYILGHMLIVSLTLFAYRNGFMRLTKTVLIRLFTLLVPLYAGAHIVNNLFLRFLDQRANYFYTLTPEAGTPLEWFYDMGMNYTFGAFEINPVYLLLTGFLGFLVIMMLYYVDHLIHAVQKDDDLISIEL